MSVEAVIRVLNGPQEGETRSLHSGQEIVVGRRADNPLSINDGYMSRQHFRIFATDNEVRVEDAGSSHGTLVNGSRVEGSRPLSGADVIRAGATEFQVSVVVSATPSDDSDWSSDIGSPSPSKSSHVVPARTIQKAPSAVIPSPSPMDSGWDDLWDDSAAAVAKPPAEEVESPAPADEGAPTREQPVVRPGESPQPELKPAPAVVESPDWDNWDVPPAAQAAATGSSNEAQDLESGELQEPAKPAEQPPALADDWDEPPAAVEAPVAPVESPKEVAPVEPPRAAPLVSDDSWEAAWEDEPPAAPREAKQPPEPSKEMPAPAVKSPVEPEPISLVVEAPAKPVIEKAPLPLDDEWDDLPSKLEAPEESPEPPPATPGAVEQSVEQKKPAEGKSAADLDWWPD